VVRFARMLVSSVANEVQRVLLESARVPLRRPPSASSR
jgi:hypothetical protein